MRINDWRKFVTFIALLLFIATSVLLIICKENHEVKEVIEYEVECGDTLWSIGTEYRPNDMSIQEYIYNLQEYNNIGSIIYPNQIIQILIYEEVE